MLLGLFLTLLEHIQIFFLFDGNFAGERYPEEVRPPMPRVEARA
jgi:hypothetical protein